MLLFLRVVNDKVVFVLNRSVGQARSTPDELEVLRAIFITETFQDLPEPSHHIFLYLNKKAFVVVALLLGHSAIIQGTYPVNCLLK